MNTFKKTVTLLLSITLTILFVVETMAQKGSMSYQKKFGKENSISSKTEMNSSPKKIHITISCEYATTPAKNNIFHAFNLSGFSGSRTQWGFDGTWTENYPID